MLIKVKRDLLQEFQQVNKQTFVKVIITFVSSI